MKFHSNYSENSACVCKNIQIIFWGGGAYAELPTVTKKIVFVTKFGREYKNTKVHPKSMNLASYGTECYRHSFPTVKANTRHLF